MKSGVLRVKNSTVSPARWAGALTCWKVTLRAVSKPTGIFHIGKFCFWVPFLKHLFLRNCAMDFVEICNVYLGKTIIKAAKRIFNSDKTCRSYSIWILASPFLEYSVCIIIEQHAVNEVFAHELWRYNREGEAVSTGTAIITSVFRRWEELM